MDKEGIIAEIRRTAAENGGAPLGQERFERETGISVGVWRGRYWLRWSQALEEAGSHATLSRLLTHRRS